MAEFSGFLVLSVTLIAIRTSGVLSFADAAELSQRPALETFTANLRFALVGLLNHLLPLHVMPTDEKTHQSKICRNYMTVNSLCTFFPGSLPHNCKSIIDETIRSKASNQTARFRWLGPKVIPWVTPFR